MSIWIKPIRGMPAAILLPAIASAEGRNYLKDGAALGGTDAVACFEAGEPVPDAANHPHEWRGAQWYFAGARRRDMFAGNPEACAPHCGGWCTWAAAGNYAAATLPEVWHIVDGKRCLNTGLTVKCRWEKDIEGYIRAADANWPNIFRYMEDREANMNRRDFLLLTLGAGISLMLPAGAAMGNAKVREFHPVTDHSWDLGPLTHDPAFWRDFVSDAAWDILFRDGTERPFSSPLDKLYEDGTYVCAACHLPLFSSDTKYDSRTGWPSFYQPFEGHMGTQEDRKLWMVRTEYHCIRCRGHQGHVFEDGPRPTGQRWCNNGLALHFVPVDEPLPQLRG